MSSSLRKKISSILKFKVFVINLLLIISCFVSYKFLSETSALIDYSATVLVKSQNSFLIKENYNEVSSLNPELMIQNENWSLRYKTDKCIVKKYNDSISIIVLDLPFTIDYISDYTIRLSKDN